MLRVFTLIAAVLMLSFSPRQQDALKWYQWNEGYPIAQKQGKMILVDAYTDWCGWCKKMDRDTYTNSDVIKKLNQHFIIVKFNPEQREKVYQVDSKSYNARSKEHT